MGWRSAEGGRAIPSHSALFQVEVVLLMMLALRSALASLGCGSGELSRDVVGCICVAVAGEVREG